MKKGTCALLALLALGSGGCAMYAAKYEEPYTGSIATVVFTTNAPGVTEPFIFRDAAECSGLQAVGHLQQGQKTGVRVVADRELATQVRFNVLRGNIRTTCGVMVSFKPETGNVYEVGFRIRPDLRACAVRVLHLDSAGDYSGERVRATRRTKLDSTTFDTNSAYCRPL
jgi:hypothetical protein